MESSTFSRFSGSVVFGLEIVSDTGRELIDVVHVALLQIYVAVHTADRPVFVDVVLSTDVSADTESFFFAGGVALLSVFCLVLTKTETGAARVSEKLQWSPP